MTIRGNPTAHAALEALRHAEASGIAVILAGPSGVGKTFAAHAFIRSWLGDGFERGLDPDFIHLTLPEKKSEIPVELVREARRALQLRPMRAAVRILHVHPGDRLNEEGMNTLLKTLEEPPDYAIILLECSRTSRLQPTVVSRCRVVRFNPLPAEEVRAWLSERHGVDAERARRVAALADGSLTRAETLALAWDRLAPDRLPGSGPASRADARWALRLWGRAVSAAIRVRAGMAPELAAPWLSRGQLDLLCELDHASLLDILDRVIVAQGQLEQNINPGLLISSITLAARP